MPKKTDLDLALPRTTRERAQIDRLLTEYTQRIKALAIVNDILYEDDQRRSHAALNGKLLAAAQLREQANITVGEPDALADVPRRHKKYKKRKKYTRQIVPILPGPPVRTPAAIQQRKQKDRALDNRIIAGERMVLFLLEHFSPREFRTSQDIIDDIRRLGYPPPGRFSSALGLLTTRRWAKREGKGFKLLWNGTRTAKTMRSRLVREKRLMPGGGYLVPANMVKTKPRPGHNKPSGQKPQKSNAKRISASQSRWNNMSPERRKELLEKMADARWKGHRKTGEGAQASTVN